MCAWHLLRVFRRWLLHWLHVYLFSRAWYCLHVLVSISDWSGVLFVFAVIELWMTLIRLWLYDIHQHTTGWQKKQKTKNRLWTTENKARLVAVSPVKRCNSEDNYRTGLQCYPCHHQLGLLWCSTWDICLAHYLFLWQGQQQMNLLSELLNTHYINQYAFCDQWPLIYCLLRVGNFNSLGMTSIRGYFYTDKNEKTKNLKPRSQL